MFIILCNTIANGLASRGLRLATAQWSASRQLPPGCCPYFLIDPGRSFSGASCIDVTTLAGFYGCYGGVVIESNLSTLREFRILELVHK